MSDYKIETKMHQSATSTSSSKRRPCPVAERHSNTIPATSGEEVLRFGEAIISCGSDPADMAWQLKKICDLEGGVAAMLTSSGQAASFYGECDIVGWRSPSCARLPP